MRLITTALMVVMASLVEAHVALWHPAMYGLYGDRPQPEVLQHEHHTYSEPKNPLKADDNLPVEKWWGHGNTKYPPVKGAVMELPAGGVFVGELGCDRANTSMGYPFDSPNYDKEQLYACKIPNGKASALHNMQNAKDPINLEFFGGSALAIAYESDVSKVKPTDMTIISVNYTSPYYRLTNYHIPAELPPCPPGGCTCSWNWIHSTEYGEGYGREIYNNVYRCNVTGKTNPKNKIVKGAGKVPKYCEGKPNECVKGPKQPMYLWQLTGNNMPVPTTKRTPRYREWYGFQDGAQKDLFINQNNKRQGPRRLDSAP